MSWRVLIPDGLAPPGLEILLRETEVIDGAGLEAVGDVDALIVRGRTRVTRDLLGRAPRLRVVGRAGVGLDNVDLEAARARGVVVVYAPLAATVAVAEHTLGLMLALARRIPEADAGLRRGEWNKAELAGVELHGKTLGLIGLGRIGAAVAERATAMGMRVLAYDPGLNADEARQRHGEACELDVLLASSDFLSLHLPLNDETRGLLDAAALAQLKPGARLVCAARGGLIDEAALLRALDEGRLAGAALDVFQDEPPGLTPLIRHPRLISTPHIGAQTAEAQARAAIDIAGEVLAALRGEALRWRAA
jgi:D-3-phosphoglycerate dehydrogenase